MRQGSRPAQVPLQLAIDEFRIPPRTGDANARDVAHQRDAARTIEEAAVM